MMLEPEILPEQEKLQMKSHLNNTLANIKKKLILPAISKLTHLKVKSLITKAI
jgi:hypothetical protein